MKKKVLMSIVLLAFVTVGAAFAQTATLDKLTLTAKRSNGKDYYEVKMVNNKISGAVVIPETYNNIPVTTIPTDGFRNCTGIASVTIPASMATIGIRAFNGCSNLTSVTFGGSATAMNEGNANSVSFIGDLHIVYKANGAGTYTRPAGGNTWTKQSTASAPTPAPAPTYLEGYWQLSNGQAVNVKDNTAVLIRLGSLNPLSSSAVEKGYIKEGDQSWRNIRSTGNLTWSGQKLDIRANPSNPNVATGTAWSDFTLTMSADGQTLTQNNGIVWTRLWVQ